MTALNITIGMTVWMRTAAHPWAMCAEMGAAMFVPAVLVIVLFRAGVVDGPAAGGVLMGAMVPANGRRDAVPPCRVLPARALTCSEAVGKADARTRGHTRLTSHLLRERR